MKVSMKIVLATTIYLILQNDVSAQTSPSLSPDDFSQPIFVQHLLNGQPERVEIQGLTALYYGLAAYVHGVQACPSLMQRSPTFYTKLMAPAAFGPLLRIFEARLKMDDARDSSELIAAIVEGPVLFTALSLAQKHGVSDVNTLISARGCHAPETSRFVASAERLAEALLVVSEEGEKPYKRPASLAGLPETTQRLFDEYHLCRVRTRTFHIVPGGITDPCDSELFAFNVSEAKATGEPVPKRSISYWQSSRGVVGKYAERPTGVAIVIDEAPPEFTPEVSDILLSRGGQPCINCGASDGWLIGSNVFFKLNYNQGRKDRIYKVTLTKWGYDNWIERARMLRCHYYNNGRTVTEANYWYKNKPGAEFDRRVPSLGRPLPRVIGVSDECPTALTADVKRRL